MKTSNDLIGKSFSPVFSDVPNILPEIPEVVNGAISGGKISVAETINVYNFDDKKKKVIVGKKRKYEKQQKPEVNGVQTRHAKK